MKPVVLSAAIAALALAACNKGTAPNAVPATNSGTQMDSSTVVATYDGKQITLGELDSSLTKDFYELRRQALETQILRDLVAKEAKKAGKTEEEFLRGIAEKAAPPPSDEDLRKIYEENKEAFGNASFEDVKPMLKARSGQQEQQQAVVEYLEKLKAENNVKINLPEPRTKVAAVGPMKGPENAPVTIVEFSDFECPYCDKAKKIVDQVLANYAGKVKLHFRNFPLPFHAEAPKAAEAGLCAAEQNKFWEMHDYMFENQDKLAPAQLKEAAGKLGLDTKKFDECLDSNRMASKVQDDVKAGKDAGVTGTPAFFINGRMISGAQGFDRFKEVIDEELAAPKK